MFEIVAKTFCDFNMANRKDVLSNHRSVKTAKRQFKRLATVYNGIHGWRVWTELTDGNNTIICDTE